MSPFFHGIKHPPHRSITREGKAKLVKKLETVQVPAAKKIFRFSRTGSNIALRAELRLCPLETKERHGKIEKLVEREEHAEKE